MFQSFNTMQSEVQTNPSIKTFREYYMSFIVISDPYLENGWGWFVDVELNSEPIIIQQYKKPSQYCSIPRTIQEYPSIRSMKSIQNLHDTSMIFEMDDIDDSKHRTNRFVNIVKNIVIIMIVILCYYLICGKQKLLI